MIVVGVFSVDGGEQTVRQRLQRRELLQQRAADVSDRERCGQLQFQTVRARQILGAREQPHDYGDFWLRDRRRGGASKP